MAIEWLIMHNPSGTVWVAYNRHDDALTCHLLLDTDLDIYDPDPMVPQDIIEEFWEQRAVFNAAREGSWYERQRH